MADVQPAGEEHRPLPDSGQAALGAAEDDQPAGGEDGPAAEGDYPPLEAVPEVAEPCLEPEELWQQVDAAVAAGPSAITQLLPLLQQLCGELCAELGTLPPGGYGSGHDGSSSSACPHVKACLEHLHVLESILGMEPPPVAVQYRQQPQPAVGTHRVLASEAVAHLVMAQSTLVDTLVAASQLVPRIVHLALQHPLCSALHVRVLVLLKAATSSNVDDLLVPMMRVPGWGLGLRGLPAGASSSMQAPSSSGTGAAAAASEQQLCPPLPSLLICIARAAVGVVGARRNPLTGFVLEACRVLRDATEAPPPVEGPHSEAPDDSTGAAAAGAAHSGRAKCNIMLELALMTDVAWSEFTAHDSDGADGDDYLGGGGVHGVLAQLCQEQEGDLGGPRPAYAPSSDDGSLVTELPGGGLLTGPEMLAFLQGLSLA